jgi:hypothetical protein
MLRATNSVVCANAHCHIQVWLCVKKPACLLKLAEHMPQLIGSEGGPQQDQDFMCYAFDEEKETFIPW